MDFIIFLDHELPFWGKLFRRRRLLNRDLSNGLRPPNSSGLLPQSTHCYGCRLVDWATRRRTEGSPRDVRGFGSCDRQFRRREPKEAQTMPSLSIEKSPEPQERPQKGECQILCAKAA
jgi:hypothetical protein